MHKALIELNFWFPSSNFRFLKRCHWNTLWNKAQSLSQMTNAFVAQNSSADVSPLYFKSSREKISFCFIQFIWLPHKSLGNRSLLVHFWYVFSCFSIWSLLSSLRGAKINQPRMTKTVPSVWLKILIRRGLSVFDKVWIFGKKFKCSADSSSKSFQWQLVWRRGFSQLMQQLGN